MGKSHNYVELYRNRIEKQAVNPMIHVCYEKYVCVCENSKFLPAEKKVKETRIRCNLGRKSHEKIFWTIVNFAKDCLLLL